MMRVALLHAYSPKNSGDGLLVDQAMSLVREALGAETVIDICNCSGGGVGGRGGLM